MTTHNLVNGTATLDITVDCKNHVTAVFSDPNTYDEREFTVTCNTDNAFMILQDIIVQFGFADNPFFRASGWELDDTKEATVAKEAPLNSPTRKLEYGVITAYPHSVKFTAILSDMKGVAVTESPEIIFLKPSHPAYTVSLSHASSDKFVKLTSWLAEKKIAYETLHIADYAETITFLVAN
jgi:hypothetical protein